MDDPMTAWPQPGLAAVKLFIGRSRTAKVVRIARLTEAQIVTTDGERYRRDNNRLIGERTDAWSGHTELHSPASPQAIDVLAQQEWVAVVSDVANRTRPASAEDTLVALGHLIAQIAEARFRITRLLEGK